MSAHVTWLGHAAAAKRVRRSVQTIRSWGRAGMPMGWAIIDGPRARVVREDVLLAWYGQTLANDSIHQQRMRQRARLCAA